MPNKTQANATKPQAAAKRTLLYFAILSVITAAYIAVIGYAGLVGFSEPQDANSPVNHAVKTVAKPAGKPSLPGGQSKFFTGCAEGFVLSEAGSCAKARGGAE